MMDMHISHIVAFSDDSGTLHVTESRDVDIVNTHCPEELASKVSQYCFETRDQLVAKELIKLGWTPPMSVVQELEQKEEKPRPIPWMCLPPGWEVEMMPNGVYRWRDCPEINFQWAQPDSPFGQLLAKLDPADL